MATRTHTVYFSGKSLEPIRIEELKLREDYESRSPYMSETARVAYAARLGILRHAISLLAEPVDPSLT